MVGVIVNVDTNHKRGATNGSQSTNTHILYTHARTHTPTHTQYTRDFFRHVFINLSLFSSPFFFSLSFLLSYFFYPSHLVLFEYCIVPVFRYNAYDAATVESFYSGFWLSSTTRFAATKSQKSTSGTGI